MPNRPWRRCDKCDWWEQDTTWIGQAMGECHRHETVWPLNPHDENEWQSIDLPTVQDDFWCSEWKSAEPETCEMCHWFFPFCDGQKGVCNHSMVQPRNYNGWFGACDHFRRKDAD